MIVLLAVAGVGAVAGGLVAASSRDPRRSLAGLGALLLLAPFVDDPLPGLLPLAARLLAAALAIELLWIAVRDRRAADGQPLDGLSLGDLLPGELRTGDLARTRPARRPRSVVEADRTPAERLGGFASGLLAALVAQPIELGAAAIGFLAGIVAGAGVAGAAGLAEWSPMILGIAFALVAVGVTPLLLASDAFRVGSGAIVVLVGASLIRTAVNASQTPLEQVVMAALVVAVGAAVAAVSVNAEAVESEERGRHPLDREEPDDPDGADETVEGGGPPSGRRRLGRLALPRLARR